VSDKCQSECASGPVADLLNDLGVGQPALPQQGLGHGHAPLGGVFHRRAANLPSEPLEKPERDRPAAFAIAEATDLAISLDVEKVARLGAQIRI